jgi:hypothetical protein
MNIFTKMDIDYILVGKTQPGHIILFENKLWSVVNRTREETCRLCRSLHTDSCNGYENKVIKNSELCGLISEIKIYNPEDTKNQIVQSVDKLIERFLNGLL